MSYCDLYIGRLDDPDFSWDEGNWDGNVPTRRSPFFPAARGLGYGAFSELRRRIDNGMFLGKQTDWGGWVARVSKAEICRFIADLYDDDSVYGPGSQLPHLRPQLEALYAFVARLSDTQEHALVAAEL